MPIGKPGNMGKVFDMDWSPVFGDILPLTVFSQMMSMTSGGTDDDDDDIEEVACWTPSPTTVDRIRQLCPNLTRLRLLIDDGDMREMEKLVTVTEIEAHITWSGFTAGLDFWSLKLGPNLTKVELTLLDNYSWSTVLTMGNKNICCDAY